VIQKLFIKRKKLPEAALSDDDCEVISFSEEESGDTEVKEGNKRSKKEQGKEKKKKKQ